MRKPVLAATVAAAVLAAPAAAQAHVTLNPREVTAGAFTVMTVRVPNERDDKGTVKVDVRFPDGFYFLSYKKVPGWKAKITREKLDTPVEREGLKITRADQPRRLDRQPQEGRDHQARPVRGVPDLRPGPRGRGRLLPHLPGLPDLPRRRARPLDRRARGRAPRAPREAARAARRRAGSSGPPVMFPRPLAHL